MAASAAAMPTAAGDVRRPAPPLALLSPAVELGPQPGAVAHHQRPDPLRPPELVRADRHQIGGRGDGGDVQPRHGLDRVGVEDRTRRSAADHLGKRRKGLDRADLVVDRHHRDQPDLVGARLGQPVRIDHPVLAWADLAQLGSGSRGKCPAGVEHRVVLDGRAHQGSG